MTGIERGVVGLAGMTEDRELEIDARHVSVLLAPDELRVNIVDMPECLGRWEKRRPSGRHRWVFVLSEVGREVAAETKALSDAANDSMREYLQGEHANCFPGAFRDGFARGVAWARKQARESEAAP